MFLTNREIAKIYFILDEYSGTAKVCDSTLAEVTKVIKEYNLDKKKVVDVKYDDIKDININADSLSYNDQAFALYSELLK